MIQTLVSRVGDRPSDARCVLNQAARPLHAALILAACGRWGAVVIDGRIVQT